MIRIRRSSERGHADHGWLDTFHTFSFADYYDPAHQEFRALRVINEDRVAPGQGFGMHGHKDMEIVTIVLEGALEHKDSLGNGEILRPGEFQRMSAGSGIRHSEFNPSETEPVHLYQIWLQPERKGIAPSYEQKAIPNDEQLNALRLVASPNAENGSLFIHQNARLYLSKLEAGHSVTHAIAKGRAAWVQTLRGSLELNGQKLNTGDGAAIENESELVLKAAPNAEVLLFDLA
ncbi:MAG: pirin family protein [Planctomycetota bacterium]